MAQYGIGVSGLNAFSEAIDVTSNNISNSQTIGYKAAEFVFSDQFFKAQNPQSMDRAGMGTSRMIIRRANTYGTISGTQNPLDLAIAGPGMFILAKQADGSVPTENPQKFQYTRNGQFAVDSQQRIVNENGLFLVGHAADATGTIITSTKSVLKMDDTPLSQVPSRKSTIEINLDNRASSLSGRLFDRLEPSSYSQATSQTVYDDKGTPHTLSIFSKKVNSADLVLTRDSTTGTTFTFGVDQSIGTTLNGEQTNKIATTAVANTVTGSTQTLASTTLTYLSGGSESSNGVKSATISPAVTSYIDGIYKNVALTGGTSGATGALGTVTVADGVVTSLIITETGSGYTSTEALTGTFGNSYSITATNAQLTSIPPTSVITNFVNTTIATTYTANGSGTGSTNAYDLSGTTLSRGEAITIAGITFTAAATTTGASLATQFAAQLTSATAGTTGTFTGTKTTGWAGGAVSGGTTLTVTATATGAATTSLGNVTRNDNEKAAITFTALAAGRTVNVAGVSFTAGTNGATAAEVAAVFQNLANGATGNSSSVGTVSGNLIGYSTGALSTATVTFTSTATSTNVTNLSATVIGDGMLGAVSNLKLSDGTILTVKRRDISEASVTTPRYTAEVDRYAMFATIDTIPVGINSTGTGTTAIKLSGLTNYEQTSIGTMAFIAGKNLDSLSRDANKKPQFNSKFTVSATGGTGNTWGKTTNGGVMSFDVTSTETTAYSSSAQTYANTQDGSPTAQLTAYSFDAYGKLVAQYDNGKSITKGQLILATFNNFEGLIPVGGNGFQASSASGDPREDTPNGSQMGAVRAQALEQSNVDLTQQLVRLMVLQRAYSAASQATKTQVATLIDDTLRIGA
ncbi:MAG: flagellar hook-basal body complex protein [Burkholderiaceae bacterium]|nr:flagellar hook-basal body complex protein [Burkholderiaceae bacterium]